MNTKKKNRNKANKNKNKQVPQYRDGSFLQGFGQVAGALAPIAGMIPGAQVAAPILGAVGGISSYFGNQMAMKDEAQNEINDMAYTANPHGFAYGGNMNSNDYVFSKRLGTADGLKKALKKLSVPKGAMIEYKGNNHAKGGILLNNNNQAITGNTSRQNPNTTFGGGPVAELEGGELRVDDKQLIGMDQISKFTAKKTIDNYMNKNEIKRLILEGQSSNSNPTPQYPNGGGLDLTNLNPGATIAFQNSPMIGYNPSDKFMETIDGSFAQPLATSTASSTSSPPSPQYIQNYLSNMISNLPTNSASTVTPMSRPNSMLSTNMAMPAPIANPYISSNKKASSITQSNAPQPDYKRFINDYKPLLIGQALEIGSMIPSLLQGPVKEPLRFNQRAGAVESNLAANRINLDPIRNRVMGQTNAAITASRGARSQAAARGLQSSAYANAMNSMSNISMQQQQANNQYRSQLAQAQLTIGSERANERKRVDVANRQNEAAFFDQLRTLGMSASNTGKFIQNDLTRRLSNQETLALMQHQYSNFKPTLNLDQYKGQAGMGETPVNFSNMYGGYIKKSLRKKRNG